MRPPGRWFRPTTRYRAYYGNHFTDGADLRKMTRFFTIAAAIQAQLDAAEPIWPVQGRSGISPGFQFARVSGPRGIWAMPAGLRPGKTPVTWAKPRSSRIKPAV